MRKNSLLKSRKSSRLSKKQKSKNNGKYANPFMKSFDYNEDQNLGQIGLLGDEKYDGNSLFNMSDLYSGQPNLS